MAAEKHAAPIQLIQRFNDSTSLPFPVILIRAASELKPGNRPVCAAIGMFDGVHLGHQQIIRQTVADAAQHRGRALVITFDRHPASVVAPERAPALIQPLQPRLRSITALDADTLLLIYFDRAFSQQTGEVFVRGLARDVGRLRSLSVGADFHFGFQRSGNVALLRKLGAELRFTVHSVAAVALDGLPISSTRIRKAIRQGDFAAAGRMLGRAYSLAGGVVQGDGLGRQLDFPTANLDVTGLVLPPTGVYAIRAQLGDQSHRGVMNIGFRPTLASAAARLQVETHLLDFTGDLYGQELEVSFVARLREERKFASTTELREQIARDIAEARQRFAALSDSSSPVWVWISGASGSGITH